MTDQTGSKEMGAHSLVIVRFASQGLDSYKKYMRTIRTTVRSCRVTRRRNSERTSQSRESQFGLIEKGVNPCFAFHATTLDRFEAVISPWHHPQSHIDGH